jgi:lipopolysaccharide biosynthesis regulator YciM
MNPEQDNDPRTLAQWRLEAMVGRKLRRVYMDAGKWALAAALQETVLARTEKPEERAAEERLKVVIRYEQAKQIMGEGKDKDAASLLRLLVKDHPEFVSAWVLLGEILHRDKEDEKAVGAWQEGFLATRSGVLLHKIEDLFLEKEQPEAALEVINQMRFKVQRDIIPRFFLGRLYYRLEMMEEAYRFLGNLRTAAPHSAVLHYLLGSIEERMGKGSQAAGSYKRAIVNLAPVQNEYFCFSCSTPQRDWSDRCPKCRAWNSVEINFKEEIREDELGLKVSPIANPLF